MNGKYILSLFMMIIQISCENYNSYLGEGEDLEGVPIHKISYNQACSSCHGELSKTTKFNADLNQINLAIDRVPAMRHLKKLTDEGRKKISMQLIKEELKNNGNYLYKRFCSQCHLELERSNKAGATAQEIYHGISVIAEMKGHPTLGTLSNGQLSSISIALREKQDSQSRVALNRISLEYYRNSLSDLFGGSITDLLEAKISNFPKDDDLSGYANSSFSLTQSHVLLYQENARFIGSRLTGPHGDVRADGFGCIDKLKDTGDECALKILHLVQEFLFSKKTRLDEIKSIFDEIKEDNPDETIRRSIEYALLSPEFIFNLAEFESDNPSLIAALFLAKVLWNSKPDQQLLEKAWSRSLESKQAFIDEMGRMTRSPKFSRMLKRFLQDVYGFYINEASGLGKASLEEIFWLFSRQYHEDLPFSDLLMTSLSFLTSEKLAGVYGVSASLGKPVTLPAVRQGILSRHFFLAQDLAVYHPIKRGAFLRRQILCDTLNSPDPSDFPPDALEPPKSDHFTSLAEMWTEKTRMPECKKCHDLINPLGFITSNFGADATWQDKFTSKGESGSGPLSLETRFIPFIGFDRFREVSNVQQLQELLNDEKVFERCYLRHFWRDRIPVNLRPDLEDALIDFQGGGMKTMMNNMVLRSWEEYQKGRNGL